MATNSRLVLALACTMLWTMAGLHQATASCYNGKSKVVFTKYWIAKEGSKDEIDDGKIITLSGRKTKTIIGENHKAIAKVDKKTFDKCVEEGTCFLSNGKLINAGSRGDVFEIVDRKKFPFGIGDFDTPLVPFVSVAVDDLPRNTKLFVKELHNKRLPNGKIHNGCVRVDDRGVFGRCHIDFFVVFFANYQRLDPILPDNAHAVIKHDCKILSYT